MIRIATANDFERINQLFIQMIQYVNEENKKAGLEVDEEVFKNGYEEGYLENFINNPERYIYVYENDNGDVLGYISCVKCNNNDLTFTYLDDFCVDLNCRGNGIGKMLLSEVFSGLDDSELIRLHVESNNSKALDFYKRIGFQVIEENNNRILMQKVNQKKKTNSLI